MKTTAAVFYKKLMAGHLYRPEQKIKGNVCLIKCTRSMTKHAEDYGLIEVGELRTRAWKIVLILHFKFLPDM